MVAHAGYFDSPWPAEDAGPQRLQTPQSGRALALKVGERLQCTTRNTFMSTMTVLGAPGDVFLLTHQVLREKIGLPTHALVERIDPISLKSVRRSPLLDGGPMWPGGMAVLRSGLLVVVYGRYLHVLSRDCVVLSKLELPVNEAYNSFVVLDNGLVVTKNLSETTAACLSVVQIGTDGQCAMVCADLVCAEPSIARLSAIGNTVYVVGTRSIFRYHWSDSAATLVRDVDWRWNYIGETTQTFGWDVVLDGQNAWFMDNGKHRYFHAMTGKGVNPTPNRLLRVSMQDSADHQAIEICGTPGGSITNPPLFDPQRQVVVGYDSANRSMQAWRFDGAQRSLVPLWHKRNWGCASHMVLYPETGELFVNDYRRFGEEVVVLDLENGTERARVRVGGFNQGVVFPAVGWGRDVYWCSMTKVARIFAE